MELLFIFLLKLMVFRMINLFSIFAVNNLSGVFDDFGDFAFGGQSFEGGFGEGGSDLHSLGSTKKRKNVWKIFESF